MAWQGRRFKTQKYKDYEKEALILLRGQEKFKGKNISLSIKFYLKYASTTDIDNLLKPLFDILTKAEIITDDRYIYKLIVEKYKAKEDRVEIEKIL